MFQTLQHTQQHLAHHPLFPELNSLARVRRFMESHVFAVWDFMSLLKRLQQDITCVTLPWRPSAHSSELVRFINQIVLGEESDVDEAGVPVSHFELYLMAMEEVGADTSRIKEFVRTLDDTLLPAHAQRFTAETLQLAQTGSTVEVAASFFYGREKAIPSMFQGIVDVLKSESLQCPKFLYYLERHIHVDGEEHGPLSEKCLAELCGGDPQKLHLAQAAGLKALRARDAFWNAILTELKNDTRVEQRTPESPAASSSCGLPS